MPIVSRNMSQKVLGFRGERSVHVINTIDSTGAKRMNMTLERIAHDVLDLDVPKG